MRRILIAASAAVLLAAALPAAADEYVNGYMRNNGTQVAPYMRTAPDGNPYNNYSTSGNFNPYTGTVGTHNPYGTQSAPSYGAPTLNGYGPYGIR